MKCKNINNEGNPNWNPDSKDYDTIHAWANRKLKKPEKCPECGKKSNLDLCHKDHSKGRSEDIYNRDLNEWVFLCRSCHMKADGRMNNLKQFIPSEDPIKNIMDAKRDFPKDYGFKEDIPLSDKRKVSHKENNCICSNHSSLECNDNNIEKGKSQLSSYSEDKDPSDERFSSEEVSRIDEGSDIPLSDKAECIGCDDYEELIYYHNDVKECMI